jgi:hypothetical protein
MTMQPNQLQTFMCLPPGNNRKKIWNPNPLSGIPFFYVPGPWKQGLPPRVQAVCLHDRVVSNSTVKRIVTATHLACVDVSTAKQRDSFTFSKESVREHEHPAGPPLTPALYPAVLVEHITVVRL